MNRSTIRSTIAALAIVGAVAGTIATASADTDPCDQVPAAQDKLQAATAEWEGTSVAYDIARDLRLDNAPTIYADLQVRAVEYRDAIKAYDAARDACAASK